jgi:hypothetical protein
LSGGEEREGDGYEKAEIEEEDVKMQMQTRVEISRERAVGGRIVISSLT